MAWREYKDYSDGGLSRQFSRATLKSYLLYVRLYDVVQCLNVGSFSP